MFKLIFPQILKETTEIIKYVFHPNFSENNSDHIKEKLLYRLSALIQNFSLSVKYLYFSFIFDRNISQSSILLTEFVKQKLFDLNIDIYPVLIYLIKNKTQIKNLEDKLVEFFKLNSNEDEFESQLNEIIGVYFLEYQVKQSVIAVENRHNMLISPLAKENQSCDILATDGKDKIYYEVKKSFSQDKRPKKLIGKFEHFEPISNYEIKKWLRNQLFESNKKGADYLLVRLPFWTSNRAKSENEKIDIWMKNTFKYYRKITINSFEISLNGLKLEITKGFYIMFPHNYIKILVNREIESKPAVIQLREKDD